MRIDKPGQGLPPDQMGDAGAQQAAKTSGPLANLFTDSVERFQSLVSLYDNFLYVSQQLPEASNLQQNAQLLMDMQNDADLRMQQAQLSGPTGSESTTGSEWGEKFRGWAEKGMEAGVNAAKGKAKWGDKGSEKLLDEKKKYGDAKMPDNLTNLGKWGKGTTIAEAEWHLAQFGAVDYKTSGDWGSFYAKGATEILKVQGRVYGDVGFKDWTLNAGIGVQGRIELIGSHYEIGYTSPEFYNLGGHPVNINGKVNADAWVGAQGDAHAEIGLGKNTHIGVGAEGFAGASASLAGQVGVGDFGSVRGGATAWAGVGAKATADIGFKDGKFSFDFGVGLALGIGAELDWGFTIDFYAIGDALYNVAAETWDWVGDAGDWVAGAASDAANWVGDAAESVGEFAEDAVDAIGNVAEDVGDAIGDAAGAVGGAISDVFDW